MPKLTQLQEGITTPAVRAYLHHAYASGICGEFGMLDRLIPYYVNLEFRMQDRYSGERTFFDVSPFVDILTISEEIGASVQRSSSIDKEFGAAKDLIGALVGFLEANFVVVVYLHPENTYWSKEKYPKRRPLQHLITGVSGRNFDGVNYMADGSFGVVSVDMNRLAEGVLRTCSDGMGDMNSYVVAVISRPISAAPCSGGESVAGRIRDYLDDRASACPELNYFYGQQCYYLVAEELEVSLAKRQDLDLRRTRLLWERARLLERMFTGVNAAPATASLHSEWNANVQNLHGIHLRCFEHHKRRTPCNDYRSLGTQLRECADREATILEKFLGCIE